MKYGAIPTNPLEQLTLWAGRVPLPMVDALYSIMKCRTIMAGVRLGLFEALRDGPLTPADVAARCALDPGATEMVLRVLVMADYLEQAGPRFALAPLARRSLIAGSPQPLTAFLEWNYRQWDMVAHLEELLATGRGVDFHHTMKDPHDWATYQRAMLEVARLDAPAFVGHVPVRPGARRLLDIAGAHGLLGAALCRRHAPMTSVVIDLPQALDTARALAVQENISDLVEHRAGDITSMDFGAGYDVALLANILHHCTPPQNQDILRRAFAALEPRGTVALWELRTPAKDSPVTAGDGAALFFRLSSTAASYAASEYVGWLTQAGFVEIRVVKPLSSPANVLVVGRKA